ncbi:alpha/beta hydrolase family protein [Kribbella orskensis]|uniref:Alpha/beta hydrolase family protein n=1 Tax=Kribbella orskensis TaxID=2512216 RepID=A0ABY2BVC6_9ACTN|nr:MULTISPECIES: alpha/beta fold hydrolase [Kribbella]TCN43971.1 alpha/beta hydrolase family protein [Kribbella sp. VKM Ac-2500]TCO32251.1 alpha/beta hydrolase family protein [Kribbella orskensis]
MSAEAVEEPGNSQDAATRSSIREALEGLKYGARSALSPRVLHGAAVELGWITTHLAMYPLGLVTGSGDRTNRLTLNGLTPAQRSLLVGDVRAAGTPILLAHGIVDNHTVFALMRRQLLRRGFTRIHTFSYSPLTLDVRRTAERMGAEIEAICEESGSEQLHVVGHSLGGLIARYYIQRLGGDERVHTCVTLGTPHQGTMAARLLPWPLVKQIRPDSDLMAELDEPAPDCRSRFVAFYSDVDQLIVPQRRARLLHPDLIARNVRINGVGHLSLPFHGEVVHQITGMLAHLDEQDTVA